ncbi:type I DNA topoisomerase [Anaplasmataceae bacterium AB001_6]|nr:type I DNA topoisomerase [Anaplasmataceae bacterium AB001_6]
MNLVIVESPAKSRTLMNYLGKDYVVLSSMGHVRSIPSKKGSVIPEKDFDVVYEDLEQADKLVKHVKKHFPNGDIKNLYLAMDPDREGEAIAWHVLELLKDNSMINSVTNVKRVTFNAITKTDVLHGFKNTRDINYSLVDAQKTRQCLDYLVGFTLSPLLWRKLPCLKSAGRVQSVALRIICEREVEIEHFQSQEYWSINCDFITTKGEKINASLITYNSVNLDKFDIKDQEAAKKIVDEIYKNKYHISAIVDKKIKRKPYQPFITSTLQQEASSKLGFSPKKTMSIAQKLYEGLDIKKKGKVGLITYMRTDGTYIASDAMKEIRSFITTNYGSNYLFPTQRKYDNKSKNIQEAHEAIRPADVNIIPDSIKDDLTIEQYRLYSLIWKRTVACQMTDAVFDSKSVDISNDDASIVLRVTGSKINFDGFYKVYREYISESKNTQFIEHDLLLKENMKLENVSDNQHFTAPPPNYTEAKLVENMEKLGIGRPSTYASIISVLQERNYVTLEKKKFIPDIKGRAAISFLGIFFSKYIEYNFTADLEDSLDTIANGKKNWKEVLKDFWIDFFRDVNSVYEIETPVILKKISNSMINRVFEQEEKLVCDKCNNKMSLIISAKGIFLGCANYPDCINIKNIDDNDGTSYPVVLLSKDSETDLEEDVLLNKGPYGFYLQKGKKRVSLPKDCDVYSLPKDFIIKISNLPYVIANFENKDITLGKSFYGFYLLFDGLYYSLRKNDFINITSNNAIDILKELISKKKKRMNKSGKDKDSKKETTKTKKKKK